MQERFLITYGEGDFVFKVIWLSSLEEVKAVSSELFIQAKNRKITALHIYDRYLRMEITSNESLQN